MTHDSIPFIVLCAPRTGSNLLVGLLASHPELLVGNELFNRDSVEKGTIPWPSKAVQNDPSLLALRQEDPVAFLNQLYTMAMKEGEFAAIGFKYLYWDAYNNAAASGYLRDNESIRVIHLKRENRLARLLSFRRSIASRQWAAPTDTKKTACQPKTELNYNQCVHDFRKLEHEERELNDLFRAHDVMQLVYEDLVSDTQGKCHEIERWLGARELDLSVRFKKMGTKSLRDSILNYDALKERFAGSDWTHFFSE